MEVNMFQSKLNIADEDVAKNLKQGLQAAAQGEVIHPAEGDDMPEWLQGHTTAGGLLGVHEATQQEDLGFSEGSAEESRVEQLKVKY